MPGQVREGEWVHEFRPAGQARVPEGVERKNAALGLACKLSDVVFLKWISRGDHSSWVCLTLWARGVSSLPQCDPLPGMIGKRLLKTPVGIVAVAARRDGEVVVIEGFGVGSS